MKIFMMIDLAIAIFVYVLYTLTAIKIKNEYLTEYPNAKFYTTLNNKILATIEMFIIILLPIINIICLLGILFCSETVEDQMWEKLNESKV